MMTADQALHIPPYKDNDQRVITELGTQFGADAISVQPTLTGVPVIWVAREQLLAVLRCLRQLPQPYVMLYALHGADERLRTHRQGLPADVAYTVLYDLMPHERNSDVMITVGLREHHLRDT